MTLEEQAYKTWQKKREEGLRLACAEAGKDYNLWKAVEIWRTNGHSENVMISILSSLLTELEQLRKGITQ